MPLPILHFLIIYGIGFILLAMFARAILSWFRIDERYAFVRFLARVTDPFIEPVRRVMRPVGGLIDLSYFVTWFLLYIIQTLLLQSLPPGW